MAKNKINERSYVIHLIIITFFIFYLVSADNLFETIIPANGESKRISIEMPPESDKITYAIDSQKEFDLEWKPSVSISGWAFLNDTDEAISEKYLTLESANSTYIFETSSIIRGDVPYVFKDQQKLANNTGFITFIPTYQIKSGKYEIGLVLKTNTTSFSIRTHQYYIKPENDRYSGSL